MEKVGPDTPNKGVQSAENTAKLQRGPDSRQDRGMDNWFTARVRHAYEVLVRHAWALGWAAFFGVIGGLITWRDELLPDDIKAKWRVLKMLPHWDWGWWALITAAVMIAIILEASFRIRRENDNQVSVLAEKLKAIGLDRSILYMNLGLNGDGSADPKSISGASVYFKNNAEMMYSYRFIKTEVFIDGKSIPLQQEGPGESYIHKDQELQYRMAFMELYPLTIPQSITVDFEIEYDNVPPVMKRVTGRRITYTLHSVNPTESINLINSQIER